MRVRIRGVGLSVWELEGFSIRDEVMSFRVVRARMRFIGLWDFGA